MFGRSTNPNHAARKRGNPPTYISSRWPNACRLTGADSMASNPASADPARSFVNCQESANVPSPVKTKPKNQSKL